MRKLLLLLTIGAALLGSVVIAQDEAPSVVWGRRFESAIQSEFPGAQLQPRQLPRRDREDYRQWVYEDSVISVGFTVLESNGEAERQLAERTMMLPAGSAPVRGFGDQAFIIQPGATVQRRMNLRRHHIVLEISAPGEIARSRLALALVAAIDEAELGRP